MDDGRKGGAALTVRSHRSKTAQFLKWFAERRRSLAAVRLRDVDDFLIFKGTSGWSRKSARGYADALRAFFRYAEQRGWCKPGIAEGITFARGCMCMKAYPKGRDGRMCNGCSKT